MKVMIVRTEEEFSQHELVDELCIECNGKIKQYGETVIAGETQDFMIYLHRRCATALIEKLKQLAP